MIFWNLCDHLVRKNEGVLLDLLQAVLDFLMEVIALIK